MNEKKFYDSPPVPSEVHQSTVYISGVSIGLNLTSKFMTSDQTK